MRKKDESPRDGLLCAEGDGDREKGRVRNGISVFYDIASAVLFSHFSGNPV